MKPIWIIAPFDPFRGTSANPYQYSLLWECLREKALPEETCVPQHCLVIFSQSPKGHRLGQNDARAEVFTHNTVNNDEMWRSLGHALLSHCGQSPYIYIYAFKYIYIAHDLLHHVLILTNIKYTVMYNCEIHGNIHVILKLSVIFVIKTNIVQTSTA